MTTTTTIPADTKSRIIAASAALGEIAGDLERTRQALHQYRTLVPNCPWDLDDAGVFAVIRELVSTSLAEKADAAEARALRDRVRSLELVRGESAAPVPDIVLDRDDFRRMLTLLSELRTGAPVSTETAEEHVGAELVRLRADNKMLAGKLGDTEATLKALIEQDDQDALDLTAQVAQAGEGLTVGDLQREAHATSKEKGWWPTSAVSDNGLVLNHERLSSALALVHSEVSEALEELRRSKQIVDWRVDPATQKLEGFGIELADIMIRVGDLADACRVDLEGCVEKKLAYNKSRPTRHGGLAL